MQAIVHERYGSPDILRVRELATPAIGPDEALIRARAASLHPGDLFAVLGSPFPVRLATGLRRPKHGVPGFDVAGTVEAVGSAVTNLRSGDQVFGVGIGTCSELVRAKAEFVVARPASIGFEEAAAIPTSALAALHGLRDAGRLQPGQRFLVHGASGGVGTFAVQLGKIMGAEVTGVCSTANVELVRSLGADRVVDYTREDFTAGVDRYDLILDNIENRPLSAVRRALGAGRHARAEQRDRRHRPAVDRAPRLAARPLPVHQAPPPPLHLEPEARRPRVAGPTRGRGLASAIHRVDILTGGHGGRVAADRERPLTWQGGREGGRRVAAAGTTTARRWHVTAVDCLIPSVRHTTRSATSRLARCATSPSWERHRASASGPTMRPVRRRK